MQASRLAGIISSSPSSYLGPVPLSFCSRANALLTVRDVNVVTAAPPPPGSSAPAGEEVAGDVQIAGCASPGLRTPCLEKARSLGEHTAERISFYRG